MPPKTIQVTNIQAHRAILEWDKLGTLVAMRVPVEVNYGSFGQHEETELVASLTQTQRNALQAIVTTIRKAVQTEYLD